MDEIEAYRKIIKENIEYDILIINNPMEKIRQLRNTRKAKEYLEDEEVEKLLNVFKAE